MMYKDLLISIFKDNPNLYISPYEGDNYHILQRLFIAIFNTMPYMYKLGQKLHWSTDVRHNEQGIKNLLKEEAKEDSESYLSYNSKPSSDFIDKYRTVNKIIETFPCQVYKINNGCWVIGPNFIIDSTVVYSVAPFLPELEECIVYKSSKYPTMQWVSYDNRGNITTFNMDVMSKGEIKGNYNDDLPHEQICNILKEDSSSIIILHGKPGTGKTNYIRNLISLNQDKTFYWLDSSMFHNINNAEFINFLLDCKNGIFILEDCEALVSARDASGNGLLSALLNISDGILGDSMHLKFICTFNADLQNIDKALLRKGRLKVKYEFKDLSEDKVKDLFKKLGINESNVKSMPICEVYNFKEDNGNQSSSRRKVGFA